MDVNKPLTTEYFAELQRVLGPSYPLPAIDASAASQESGASLSAAVGQGAACRTLYSFGTDEEHLPAVVARLRQLPSGIGYEGLLLAFRGGGADPSAGRGRRRS